MSGFSTDWLDLREPADRAARDPDLAAGAADLLHAADSPVAVDLGCGTGSGLRALQPLVGRSVRWRLVDADSRLLDEARTRPSGDAEVETVLLDLSGNVLFPFADATLVTASALFDLVSEAFVERLVATLASHGAALYLTLDYYGTTVWDPPHPLDGPVLAAFNRDQRRDKGFGAALGPDATRFATAILERAGYRVDVAASPWTLGPESLGLVRTLAAGIAEAVQGPQGLDAEAVAEWLAFRLSAAETGHVTVGHQDLLARPA